MSKFSYFVNISTIFCSIVLSVVNIYLHLFLTFRNRGWLLYFIFSTLIATGTGFNCPEYCKCFKKERLNHVQCIGQGIIGLELDIPPETEWLQLSNNSISLLGDSVFEYFGLKKLVILNLENNSIRTIGLFAFKGLKKLQSVDLSRNYLRSILPGIFNENHSLKYLSLRGNPIKMLPENYGFLSSTSLQILDISGCRLGHIPWQSFALLPKLNHLNVSNNELLTIDTNALEVLNKLQLIDASQNRLICDSHISELSLWLASRDITFEGTPCENMGGALTPTTKVSEEKKFEKMIVLHPDSYDISVGSDDYSYENFDHGCDCQSEQMKECPTQVVPTCKTKLNIPLVLTLAMLAGFVIGVLFSAIVSLLRGYVPRRQRRRYCRNENVCEIPLGTPPPAYNELIFRF
ncbi:hypothetical protein AAG570_003589 [Ranatra chinensis]|uniref:Uncharacterized protein n=1 Tax=Ranatra chinensis TaxID=642074 RepID=A0ABD0Y5A7_9HEMI